MAARFTDDSEAVTRARVLRERALDLARRDGEAYAAYMAASADDKPAALLAAAEPPLWIAEAAAEVAEIAAGIAERGANRSIIGDARTGATLAAAAAEAAARLAAMDAPGDPRAERARAAAERARALSDR